MRDRIHNLKALVACLLLSAAPAQAEAPDGYRFREVQACSVAKDAYTTRDSVSAKRSKAGVLVQIEASMNCGAGVAPTVEYSTHGSISIGLAEVYKPEDPIAACNCMRRFEILLTKPVPRRSTIYLVKRGVAIAHASAA